MTFIKVNDGESPERHTSPPKTMPRRNRRGNVTQPNVTKTRRQYENTVGGDFTDQIITPELYCPLFLNQLIPSPSCHSLELCLSTNTSRQHHHIQHNTYKNSKTLVHNVTIFIYNIIYIQDIWRNSLHLGHLHSVAESSLDRQSATTFFRPSLYLNVTLYDCRDNNHLINFALFVLDSVI